MKRIVFALAAALLLAGCAGQAPAAQLRLKPGTQPEELARQTWATLADLPDTNGLDCQTACLLLGLDQSDLAAVYGFFDPAQPGQAQLFVLQAAPQRAADVCQTLHDRLDLVRQTAAATQQQPPDWGCVINAGDWCALLLPDPATPEKTAQAAEQFLAAFEED